MAPKAHLTRRQQVLGVGALTLALAFGGGVVLAQTPPPPTTPATVPATTPATVPATAPATAPSTAPAASAPAVTSAEPAETTEPAEKPEKPHGLGRGGDEARRAPGQPSAAASTQAGAARALQQATNDIARAKADVAAAQGKMDTAQANDLLSKADALLKQAQDFNTGSQWLKASGYAAAARTSADVAEHLTRAALSPSQPATPALTAGVEQARASRELARSYTDILRLSKLAGQNNLSDASAFVSASQAAYKQAYDLYTAGKYAEAGRAARTGRDLVRVVERLLQANGISTRDTSPVTVPAPTF